MRPNVSTLVLPKSTRLAGGLIAFMMATSPKILIAQTLAVTMCGAITPGPLPQNAVYNGTGGTQCHGENISPPLCWAQPPAGTQSIAVIMYDSTADFYHWGLSAIAATTRSLPANTGATSRFGNQAQNDFNHSNYDGPCPPPGRPHLYHFRVYALDAAVSAPTAAKLAQAIKPHILQWGQITATYESP